MLLRCVLVDGSAGYLCIATADLLCLPDEVLEEIALVLSEEKNLSLLNDILEINNKLLTVR